MMLAVSIGLVAVVLVYVLAIRPQDLPYVEPHSPTGHLDERKAAIYENIRDANFEFLMGKLSQEDYQATKADLQQELNEVNAEIQQVLAAQPGAGKAAAAKAAGKAKPMTGATAPVAGAQSAVGAEAGKSMSAEGSTRFVCGNCGASFPGPMKFCGECGHKMGDARA